MAFSSLPKGRWNLRAAAEPLGANRQFNYVYRRGKRVSTKDLSLLYVSVRHKMVGFSVNKKVGVAVILTAPNAVCGSVLSSAAGADEERLLCFRRPAFHRRQQLSGDQRTGRHAAEEAGQRPKPGSRQMIARLNALRYPLLPAADQSGQSPMLPFYAHLLSIRSDGHRTFRRVERGLAGSLAHSALQSFLQRRRPPSRKLWTPR